MNSISVGANPAEGIISSYRSSAPTPFPGRHLPVVRSVEARKIHVGHPFRHIGSVIRTKRVVTLVRHRLGFTVNGPFGQHRNLDAVRLIEIHERHRSRLGESFPHGSVDDLPHGLFVSELDFGLLGMDIDVDPRRVDRQVEKIGGRTGIGNQLLVSLQDRLEKIGGAEITPVHEKILFRTIALLGGSGTAHEARHPHDRRVGIDFQQVLFDMTPHHIDDPRSQRSSGQPIERLIVHQQFEPHLRIAERDPLKLGLDLPRGSRTLFEELTAGRHVVEQIAHIKLRPHGTSREGLRNELAAIDRRERTHFVLRLARTQLHLRHGGDRRERFAPEAERLERINIVQRRNLAGSMPVESHTGVDGRHAATVVHDLNQLLAAVPEIDLHAAGSGIDRILHHLLHHRRRTVHHLTGGNLVRNDLGQ